MDLQLFQVIFLVIIGISWLVTGVLFMLKKKFAYSENYENAFIYSQILSMVLTFIHGFIVLKIISC